MVSLKSIILKLNFQSTFSTSGIISLSNARLVYLGANANASSRFLSSFSNINHARLTDETKIATRCISGLENYDVS